ncbi:MAG: cobyrinate a,c-diamide synthase [Bacillota bacterium]
MDNVKRNIPRLVVGAPCGRSGKTTVTLGLLAALKSRGLSVQPFKKGPDFIDPSWMTMVTGRACRNLDGFMMTGEMILDSFVKNAAGSDIGVVEGAMGLFDGGDIDGSGSTAEIAKAISAPVLLVVDTTRMTRSVAPLVRGFMHFDPEITIAGVILNKVARPRHESMLRQAIERYCGIPVLGVIPKGRQFTIPDRHLGLIPAAERDELMSSVEEIGRAAVHLFDMKKVMEVAGSAPPLALPGDERAFHPPRPDNGSEKPVIGLFRDRAFTFYYPENIEALEAAGASLVYIDSLNDRVLPNIDALYIGGGFPEVFAAELEGNDSLRRAVNNSVEAGLPVYAECGGLMYLARNLVWKDRKYRMACCLPFDVVMSDRPQGHGYEVVEVCSDNPFFSPGMVIKCHEFHHSRVENIDEKEVSFAFRVARGWGIDGNRDGAVYKNVLACYSHIHARSCPEWAREMVKRAMEFRERLKIRNPESRSQNPE